MAETGGWLTVEEAAKRAGVNIRKFRTMVRQGEIPTTFDRKTRRRMVHRFSVDAWIESQRIQPGDLWHLNPYSDEYKARATQRRTPSD